MNCSKCNAPLKEGALFCESCGAKIEKPEVEAGGKVQQPTAVPNTKKPMDKKLIAILLAAAVALIAIITIVVVLVTGKKKIDLEDYATVTFEGYDTVGTAQVEFDWESFYKDVRDKAKGIESSEGTDISKDIASGIAGLAAYGSLMVKYDLDKESGLSNGDVVKLTFTYDNEAAAEYGIKYVGEEIEYKASDLKDIQEIDPFEKVTVKFSGVAPDVTAQVENSGSEEVLKNIYYEMDKSRNLSEGDVVTVTIESDKENVLQQYGVKFTSDSKEYKVENVDKHITAASEISDTLIESMKTQSEDLIDAYGAENISISKVAYKGGYFLTMKDPQSWGDKNIFYMVYSATVKSKEKKFKAQEVYFPVKFSNLIKYADGTDYVEVSAASIQGNTDLRYGWFSTVKGYTKLESLKNELIDANKANYTEEAIGDMK